MTDTVDAATPALSTGDIAHAIDTPRGSETYGSDVASDLRKRHEEEAASAPTADELTEAKAELSRRVASRMGVPAVDLDVITVPNAKKLSRRQGSEALANYREMYQRELSEIVGEQANETQATEAPQTKAPRQEAQEEAQQQQAAIAAQQAAAQQAVLQRAQQFEQELSLQLHAMQAVAASEFPEVAALVKLREHNPVAAQQQFEEFCRREPAKAARLQQLDLAWQQGATQAQNWQPSGSSTPAPSSSTGPRGKTINSCRGIPSLRTARPTWKPGRPSTRI